MILCFWPPGYETPVEDNTLSSKTKHSPLLEQIMVVIAGAFISAFASPGSGISMSGSDRIMTYFNICAVFCGLASAWSKSAFAITLLRLESGRGRYFLWYALVTINASYLLYLVTAWNRPCSVRGKEDLYIPGPCWSSTAKMAVPLSVVGMLPCIRALTIRGDKTNTYRTA